VQFSCYKGSGSQVYDFGMDELKFYRLVKSSGNIENYTIITQGQWGFPYLIAEEGNIELNGTIYSNEPN